MLSYRHTPAVCAAGDRHDAGHPGDLYLASGAWRGSSGYCTLGDTRVRAYHRPLSLDVPVRLAVIPSGFMLDLQEIDALRVIGINPGTLSGGAATGGHADDAAGTDRDVGSGGIVGRCAVLQANSACRSVCSSIKLRCWWSRMWFTACSRALVFATIITLIGAANGFNVSAVEGVGRATTRSVVLGYRHYPGGYGIYLSDAEWIRPISRLTSAIW